MSKDWKSICLDASNAAVGLPVTFTAGITTYAKHNGQCIFVGAMFDPECSEFDEEALPFYQLKAPDGTIFSAGDDELAAQQPEDQARLNQLILGVSITYAAARTVGEAAGKPTFGGPASIMAAGTEDEKQEFEVELAKARKAYIRRLYSSAPDRVVDQM